jgi:hypothetical protein
VIEGRADDEPVRLEIELVFRAEDRIAHDWEEEVRAAIVAREGRLLSRCRIPDIAYHALLAELPSRFVREIIQRSPNGVAGLGPVMHIRPQSVATTIELADTSSTQNVGEAARQLGSPILALLDGVPVAGHALLRRHVTIDDQFDLEASAPVPERVHGTAMASLIIHGDRNRPEPALPRRIHVVPVMGAGDSFADDRLIVDVIYSAVIAMRGDREPTAPDVLIVNLSLGNRHRPFQGQLSPWARLLDRLAYRFGVLFLVSAGNHGDRFDVTAFANSIAFEGASSADKSTATLRAIGDIVADRRLLAPAETVNGLTIGACNDDAVASADRLAARYNIDPYPDLIMPNPSSALGPGFALSVKPDILMPGAREHLRVVKSHKHIEVRPAGAARSAGL